MQEESGGGGGMIVLSQTPETAVPRVAQIVAPTGNGKACRGSGVLLPNLEAEYMCNRGCDSL